MRVKKPLWAPWRSQYFTAKKTKGCVFCEEASNPDAPESLVVAHTPLAMAVLNLYPYASGHLMIIPKRHISLPDEMTEEELKEFWALFLRGKRALGELYGPQGFNTGMNLGEAAGAGIADHLHLHVVPRWKGDVNFMAALADIRVIPDHLHKIRDDLKAKLKG